jgi:hypothetical protein
MDKSMNPMSELERLKLGGVIVHELLHVIIKPKHPVWLNCGAFCKNPYSSDIPNDIIGLINKTYNKCMKAISSGSFGRGGPTNFLTIKSPPMTVHMR